MKTTLAFVLTIVFGASFASVAAWSQKPSYAVIVQQDRMISPDLGRLTSRRAKSETIELAGSHAIFISHQRKSRL